MLAAVGFTDSVGNSSLLTLLSSEIYLFRLLLLSLLLRPLRNAYHHISLLNIIGHRPGLRVTSSCPLQDKIIMTRYQYQLLIDNGKECNNIYTCVYQIRVYSEYPIMPRSPPIQSYCFSSSCLSLHPQPITTSHHLFIMILATLSLLFTCSSSLCYQSLCRTLHPPPPPPPSAAAGHSSGRGEAAARPRRGSLSLGLA